MLDGSNTALITFVIYTIAVFMLAVLSNRASKGKEFVGEYFLGSRSFGVWAFALTFAATNASGGTFMGFPGKVYVYGWTLALWIAGFMLVPLLAMALIGKRLNQVARKCNAITIPEILGARFGSSKVGLISTLLLLFFMFFYLLAQFKAGGKILSTLLSDEPAFQFAVAHVASATANIPWIGQAEPDYLVCLIVFSLAVVVYVVYGGFRAVVWTDVMQGIIMVIGVVLMLALTLHQVGGLENATQKLAKMTPPEPSMAVVSAAKTPDVDSMIPKGTWIEQDGELFRLAELAVIPAGESTSNPIKVYRMTTPDDAERISDQERTAGLSLLVTEQDSYQSGSLERGVYVTNPGPSESSPFGFLAIGAAISFFVFWPFGATGQPSNMVRLLAFKDARTLRYSIMTVAIYYSVIYLSLVVIFCCGRVLMPGMEIDPDRAMPDLAAQLTVNAGVPWLAGLLVAAPFAAIMSSVDSFLLVVSSSVVRDIYQTRVNPDAPARTLKVLSYVVTIVVGALAMLCVLHPPKYLQDLIVFASEGLAACFLIPMVLSLYWRNITARGAIAGMLGGSLTHLALTCWGYYQHGEFRAYEFLGMNPFIWDLVGSAVPTIAFSLIGDSPDKTLVRKFFYRSDVLPSAQPGRR